MHLESITTIFFDAADTLFYIRKGLGSAYSDVARKHGVSPDPERIKEAFSKAFRQAPPLAFREVSTRERKALEKLYWKDIVEKVYSEVGMFDTFEVYFDELFEMFRSRVWELFPEVKEVLSDLKARGFKLGVISNFDSRIYNVMSDLDICDYFDFIVISSEAGYAKPAPEIYQEALKKAQAVPRESLHIGDHVQNDFHGPRALGIKALLIDREKRYTSMSRNNKIENLRELLD